MSDSFAPPPDPVSSGTGASIAQQLAEARQHLTHLHAERDQLASELDKERHLFHALMDHLPDKIYFKDLESRFTAVSTAMVRAFGVQSASEMIGRTDFDFFTGEHATQAFEDEQKVLASGVPMIGKEERETWPDGTITWASSTKVPLRDPSGMIIGTFGISRDITDRKTAQIRLSETAEELRCRNSELEHDLAMARELQQALLPSTAPSFPPGRTGRSGSLHFSHFYRPSGSVSGDFFHILPLSDSTVGVLICDVMGHGVRAALVAALLRALVEEARSRAASPGVFLTELNEALCGILEHTRTLMFATAFYAVLDSSTGEFSFANAGHPQPLWVRHRDQKIDTVQLNGIKPGPALGLFPGARYTDRADKLSPSDLLLLFTDGLFEVEAPDGEFYDQPRLLDAVRRRPSMPAEQLLPELMQEVQAFHAVDTFDDDVCMLAIEVSNMTRSSQVN